MSLIMPQTDKQCSRTLPSSLSMLALLHSPHGKHKMGLVHDKCNDEEGGNRGRERDALIAYADDNDDLSLSSRKKVTGALHYMTDYQDQKESLASQSY